MPPSDATDDIQIVEDALLRFVDSEVLPLEKAHAALLGNDRTLYDETGRYCHEVLKLRRQVRMKSAEAGFYTMLGAAELGGGDLGPVAGVRLQETLARVYGPGRVLIHHVVIPSPFTNGLTPVFGFLQPEARERFLPSIARGECTSCFALSEPDAGSDVFGMKTRARRDGNEWVINGTKQWITNSPYADYAVVFAVTDPDKVARREGGITGFVVETSSPGFRVNSVLKLMGSIGGDTGIIDLEELRVPDSQRLGEVDGGLKVAMRGINAGRLGVAASCLGYARWSLDKAVDYAQTRKTFGKPIAEHQSIQNHLAESAMDLYAARRVVLGAAECVAAGSPARGEIAIAKALATEMLSRTVDRCMQVHGGMGMTNEVGLEAIYRFARMMRVYDGTAEIQRRTIAQELLGGHLRF